MVCVVVKSLTLCIIWGWCHIQRCSDCILDQKGKTLRWCRSGQKGESSRIKFEGQSALQRWHLGMKKKTVGSRPFWTIDTVCTGGGWQALKNVRDADSDQWLSYLWEISIMVKEGKKSTRKWGVLWTIYFFWGGTEPLLCSHHHSWSPPQPEQTDPRAHFSAAESDGEGPLFILSGLWWSHWLSERN